MSEELKRLEQAIVAQTEAYVKNTEVVARFSERQDQSCRLLEEQRSVNEKVYGKICELVDEVKSSNDGSQKRFNEYPKILDKKLGQCSATCNDKRDIILERINNLGSVSDAAKTIAMASWKKRVFFWSALVTVIAIVTFIGGMLITKI